LIPYKPYVHGKHVESILGTRKNSTKKKFNLNNTIPHSVRLVDPFVPRRVKSNLTKFQAGILEKICNNKNVIIAHADKNLGPVGVDAEQYI
jgi:hypothetical protein